MNSSADLYSEYSFPKSLFLRSCLQEAKSSKIMESFKKMVPQVRNMTHIKLYLFSYKYNYDNTLIIDFLQFSLHNESCAA